MPAISIFRAAIATLLLMVTSITPALAEGFDHASHTGIVYLDKAGSPLLEAFSTDSGQQPFLEAGADVSLVIIEPGGAQRLVQAKTVGMAVTVPPRLDQLIYSDNPMDKARYKLAIIGGNALPAGAVGFGITGAADRCGASDSVVSCDLEPGGPPQFFRTCASHEGLHFSIWSGKPLKGARRWHAYYYLGYDIDPDCTDGDYKK